MHDNESSSIPMPTKVGYVRGSKPGNCSTETIFKSWSRAGGACSSSYRTASRHNPPDEFGFRKPSSYMAYKMEGNSGTSTTCYGKLDNPTYYCYHTDGDVPETAIHQVNGTLSNVGTVVASAVPAFVPVVDQLLYLPLVRQRALENVADRKLNLALSILERQQTVDMVCDKVRDLVQLVRGLRQCVRVFRRGGKLGRCEHLRTLLRKYTDFTRLWLEYRYGWLQLYYDIHGAIEALEKMEDGTFERYRTHSSSKHAEFQDFIYRYTSNYTAGIGNASQICDGLETRWLRREFFMTRYDWSLKDLTYLRLVDSGILDPALLAWERIPYSFCVDWLFRVSGWLGAINAKTGLTYLGGSSTYGASCSGTATIGDPKVYTYNQGMQVHSKASVTAFGFTRVVEPEPTSRLVINPGGLTLTHLTDAIALFDAYLSGKSLPIRR